MTTYDAPLPRRVGLGLAAVARPAYITSGRDTDLGDQRDVETLRQRSRALLDAAYDAGVRYLDVARSYGLAEEFLADWLGSRTDLDGVLIGSKWGYRYVGGWRLDAEVHEVKDHSAATYEHQLQHTRALLEGRLSIYHVHSVTPDSPALTDGALHRHLADLRDSGVRVGISTSGPEQADAVRRALDVSVDGRPLFASVETTWNLLEPSAGAALAEAAAAGATVIVKEGVANGRLTPGSTDPAPGALAARTLADRLGVGVDQVALAACLAQPWAWQVLSGAVTVDQLRSNLAAESVRLDPGDVDELLRHAEAPQDYWSARSARPWS